MNFYVIIPVKNQWKYTKPLLDQLLEQKEATKIFLMDNGSTDITAEFVKLMAKEREELVYCDCAGMFLHAMWNRGMDMALAHARESGCEDAITAILNNDIKIGEAFLSRLGGILSQYTGVRVLGANYDNRKVVAPCMAVKDICAGRYDGTGGLPGFAFALRTNDRYRFPSELHWWCGDTDMVSTIWSEGGTCAIARDATCEHLDGGGRTGNWSDPKMQEQLAADLLWYHKKWGFVSDKKREGQ